MIPIFSSLNMMQRALQVTQEAIQTTGHNVSNAGTDGYSRQRVNLKSWLPYPAAGINAPHGAGQTGTGVIDDSIVRIRDQFVDLQVRENANQNGYWSALSDAYSQMEDIVNEPSETGISSVLDGFWQSIQDLASHSGTGGTGTVVLQRGKEVADTFNYIARSLAKVQNNLQQQITENTHLINNYADRINALNKEIGLQEANGFLANDLYDERDLLTDKLAGLVHIKVTPVPSGGHASATAEGKYTIEMVDQNGGSFDPPARLVDGEQLTAANLASAIDSAEPSVTVAMDGQELSGFSGKLQGLIEAYTNDYPAVLQSLDRMAAQLATSFNDAFQQTGGSQESGIDWFFQGQDGTVTAENLHVNEALKGSDITSNLADAPSGDHAGALALADVIAADRFDFDGNGSETTLKNYLQGLIGQIGVNAQSAQQFNGNSATMRQAAENRRASISGVNMDEEMTNLIQFQHTYGAAARVVTTIDTLLDTLINRMGG
ncbi:flagellar hook-associated protein FlgK [Sporolactobacillus sp. Y61]|uniref:Flagellar hook-associated protein 1 n=1 Tax=Sporolactobacillus sp. Y61 TaxID=3160863 RepID=A0AAU8IBL8_9BACL